MTSPANSQSYTKRDFDSNIAELDRIIRERFPQDWTDFQPGRLGNILKDLIAHDFDMLSFMLDQHAREMFVPTLELRESVLHWANAVGYEVKSAVGSSVDVNLNLANPVAEDTLILKGTKIKSVGGYTFEATNDITIPAGYTSPESFIINNTDTRLVSLILGSTALTFNSQIPDQVRIGHYIRISTAVQDYQISYISTDRLTAAITVPSLDADMIDLEYSVVNKQGNFSQGETLSESTISTGTRDIQIATTMSPALEGSISVEVDGTPWIRVDSVVQELNINVFSVRYDEDDAPTISFGDGITGNIPPEDSEIKIYATVGVGTEGNVARGSINTTLTGKVGLEQIQVFASNPTNEGSGGADRQTIAEIKEAIPAYIKSNDTAVTIEDYDALSVGYTDSEYGRIERAVTILDSNFVPYEMNLIKIYAWSSDGDGSLVAPSDGLRASLKAFLNERKMVGTEIFILNGLNKLVDLTLDLKLDVTKDSELLKTTVESEVRDLFNSLIVRPGKPLFVSKIYEVIEAIEGIDSVFISSEPPFINGVIDASNIEMLKVNEIELRESPEAPPFVIAPITSLDGTATIQWGLVASASSYEVEISEQPSFSSSTALGEVTDNIIISSGLQNGIYYFRVRSVNNSGFSEWKDATNSLQVIIS